MLLYTTLARAKEELGITDNSQDAHISMDIESATELIDAEIGENIGERTVKRRLDGTGGDRLVLPHTPTSITSLIDNRTGTNIVIKEVFENFVYLEMPCYRGRANITIEYITGHTTIPVVIERLCLDLIKEIRQERQSSGQSAGAVKKKTIGDTSYEYAIKERTAQGYVALINGESILKKFRPFSFCTVCS